jgi:hypothetical protein
MNNHNYFADAYDYANNYSNANGWSGFTDQYNYAGGAGHSNANPADSLPYVFNIANSTTDDVSSVVILGANQNTVGATNFGNAAAITITMASGAVTYQQFLENLKSQPFKTGLMHLQSSNTSQPFQVLTFTELQANGTSTTWPVTPLLDPNQNQAGVTIVKNQFTVDAWTQISTTILASATLTMRIFPMQELNVARAISSRPVEKDYNAPDLYQLPFRG